MAKLSLYQHINAREDAFTTLTKVSEPSPQVLASRRIFDERSPNYDDSWHPVLTAHYVEWASVQPGQRVLDLACGTGLITLLAAKAVGKDGHVVGVDVSPGMLGVAKKKAAEKGLEGTMWVEHDIMDLTGVKEVEEGMGAEGYDFVFCCSALPILSDPTKAIKFWAGLVKTGGKLICDVPTEHRTVQHLMTDDLRKELGIPLPFDWKFVTGPETLSWFVKAAGLEVDKAWRTGSYTGEHVYGPEDAGKVFDEGLQKNARWLPSGPSGNREESFKSIEAAGKTGEARKIFSRLFKENLWDDGKFHDGRWLYVVVGRKP